MDPQDIPTESMAVLSTAHLPEHEVNAVEDMLNNGHMIGLKREPGFMLYVGPIEARHSDSLESLNFIMGYLKARGFVWVLFDRDGELVPQFTAHAW